ncbi:hypothetical protein BX616_005683 [Lobosporangium transversale]|uniref:F-box domain-containing protein n=1 Tax=Lobosporangium transversale TaxID=64571 RepID=A0A1Y2GKL6_9FUNG|nr:hypothetical protein BCR41DRAFT_355782 [Lobosporangium transversale]KAF9915646.1 hypothetical protein BX616_005683 [Lobosporangium transversale]ORZ13445.1 hypothetical protein BCR41DRAFT_355782 [Lobosporangium transversale]|eukprot:XP_021880526.1 hypothetical protein BCR41DRAFT_355782 [Lobosporangium transversale]
MHNRQVYHARTAGGTNTARPSSKFALRLSAWLKEHRARRRRAQAQTEQQMQFTTGSASQHDEELPDWALDTLFRPPHSSSTWPTSIPTSSIITVPSVSISGDISGDISVLVPRLERMTTSDTITPLLSHSLPLSLHQQTLASPLPNATQPPPRHHPARRNHLVSQAATSRRLQAKHKQPWRRTRPEIVSRKTATKRLPSSSNNNASQDLPSTSISMTSLAASSTTGGNEMILDVNATIAGKVQLDKGRPSLYVPHDILLAIFSHLPSRANAQQYYDRMQPSDLLACSRVNMAWRIAALSTIWQTIVLPDPFDRSCRRLLHLVASSHASAQITSKNYDITEIIQRVEVDLLEAAELLTEEKEYEAAEGEKEFEVARLLAGAQEHEDTNDIAIAAEAAATVTSTAAIPAEESTSSEPFTPSLSPPSAPAAGTGVTIATDIAAMTDNITTILEYVSPFRTLSIQLPQEIEYGAAEILTESASLPILDAIVRGVQGAGIQELDMPSPMYCTVPTFPGMLNLISALQDLRVLILGYSSRDWPLLRAIISLSLLENLCVFDSCWSNQVWIYLLSSLGSRLRGLTVLQGRRPIQGPVLREGIAPYCKNLTSLSIPFIQLLSGPKPVLTDDDLIPVIKACHELQTINISGQRLLGDAVLEAIADLWSLQTLDIRDCALMTGRGIKGVRWQSIQRVRMFGCGVISQEFMDLILQAWRAASHASASSLSSSTARSYSSTSTASRHLTSGPSHYHQAMSRFSSVLDFHADVEDPIEMGWYRQSDDEPPRDLDDHFFAEWYV